MDKLYYEEYFQLERQHWWFRARKHIIERILRKFLVANEASILNIGAATGGTSAMLGQFGNVTSVEYEKTCCDFVKEKLNLDFIQASITRLPFDESSFDLVAAFDVIEHIEDDRLAVDEMIRVCKPGKLVAVTVPAYGFLWSKHDTVNHHIRRYVMNQLVALFANARGNIIYKSYFNTFLFPPIAFTRLVANRFPKLVTRSGSGSDFSYSGGSLASSLCYPLMKSEGFLMEKGISFPVGISMILLFKKAD